MRSRCCHRGGKIPHRYDTPSALSKATCVRQHSYELRKLHHRRVNDDQSIPSAKLPHDSARATSIVTFDDFDLPGSPVQHRRPTKQHLFSGWRIGALASLVGAVLICIFNFAITLWVWKRPGDDVDPFIVPSIGTFFESSCTKVRRSNTWVHLLVNALSTLLLCASNYCMQVLCAPSRQELDRAHAQRYWLHIGVPNLRNLPRIGRDRVVIWVLLFLSSVPLHLLFNSVIFTNLQANRYVVIPTTEDWLHGGQYNTSGFKDVSEEGLKDIITALDTYRVNLTDVVTLRDKQTIPKFKNISTASCFNEYNSQYISDAGNVYIVQESPTVWRNMSHWMYMLNDTRPEWIPRTEDKINGSGIYYPYTNDSFPFESSPDFYPSNGWRCPSHAIGDCNVDNGYEVSSNRSLWKPYESPVAYCMVEQVDTFCKLQFSFPIAIAVVVSNFVKAICIALTLFLYRKHTPLVTIGDAVASFLDHPDPETYGRCLHTRETMEYQWRFEDTNRTNETEPIIEPTRFMPTKLLWGSAASETRWFVTYVA